MIIINSMEEIAYYHKSIESSAVAIGTFDGLHRGHKEILRSLTSTHQQTRVVITFINHPKEFTKIEAHPMRLITLDEKIELFSEFAIDYLVLLQFNNDLMAWTYEKFIHYLTKHFKMQSLHIGFNFRLGYKGLGDVDALNALTHTYPFTIHVSSPVVMDGEVVSSTAIRHALKEGDIEKANRYLGRNHFVTGKVIAGKRLGHTIGYPTFNLKISSNMTIIRSGVYITLSQRKGQLYPSVTNVGFNPTFNQNNFNLETFILDFDENLYDEMLRVCFLHRLRDEIRFDDIEELKRCIADDVVQARAYFASELYKL